MKKQKKRKPTMKEMEIATANLIKESQLLRLSLLKTQEVLSSYIEFNKHTETFTKYVRDENGKRDKRDSKKNAFVTKIEKTRGWNYIGYGYYGNDEFWTGGFLRMDKDGIEEHISLTKAGWIEPPDPDLPDKPKLYPCPVNKKWQLPY